MSSVNKVVFIHFELASHRHWRVARQSESTSTYLVAYNCQMSSGNAHQFRATFDCYILTVDFLFSIFCRRRAQNR